MKIGYVGLGKLGSVCAAVLSKHGHEVRGYDPFTQSSQLPSYEANIDDLTPVQIYSDLDELVRWSELIFIAVQTPHSRKYGGEDPIPEERRDFEYAYLVQACRDVFANTHSVDPKTVVIVSTVLPGTVKRLISPMKPEHVKLLYSPHFIAMGTTVNDYKNPEFFLIGADKESDADDLIEVYQKVNFTVPAFVTTIDNAELIKVAYNTFISMKIVWANTMMEIAHKTGTDCDVVVDALSAATDRIISSKYLRGGVGDAGACHPRDLIAMSDLAKRLNLSVDLMGFLAESRDAQSAWLCDLAAEWSDYTGFNIRLLGKAYKPNISLTSGSIALLMYGQLKERKYNTEILDPHTGDWTGDLGYAAVYVLVTAHDKFKNLEFPKKSVVVDPHGIIKDQPGVTLVRVGRKR